MHWALVHEWVGLSVCVWADKLFSTYNCHCNEHKFIHLTACIYMYIVIYNLFICIKKPPPDSIALWQSFHRILFYFIYLLLFCSCCHCFPSSFLLLLSLLFAENTSANISFSHFKQHMVACNKGSGAHVSVCVCVCCVRPTTATIITLYMLTAMVFAVVVIVITVAMLLSLSVGAPTF